MAGLQGIKGLYLKKDWYYFQPPTPKSGGPRPKAVALKTQDLVTAIHAIQETCWELRMVAATMSGTIDEVLPKYYAAKSHDSKATRLARKVILDGFSEANLNPTMKSIDAKMIARWRGDLVDPEKGGKRGKPVSLATLKTYTVTLRAFLKWAVDQNILQHHPLPQLEKHMRATTTKREGFHTEKERELLLNAAAPDYVKLILMLGFFAGLRDGEMLALNPDWLWIADDWSRGTMTVQPTPIQLRNGKTAVWQPKNRKKRKISLHPRLLEFLKDYGLRKPFLLAPHKDTWPDETMNAKRFDAKKALEAVATRAGVKRLTSHMLRHSFATHLAMKGVPLAEIAGLLGDTLKVTEDHYAGFCPNKDNPVDVL